MKAMLKYLVAIAITLPFLTNMGYSQASLKRSIIGSAGGVYTEVNGDNTLRATYGQMLAAKQSTTTSAGQPATVYLGYWRSNDLNSGVETPIYVGNQNSMTNYPNPLTNSTTIKYNLTSDSRVTLRIYDITGAVVRTLVNEMQVAGEQNIEWNAKSNDGADVTTGSYLYELNVEPVSSGAEGFSLRNVMVVSK